MTRIITLLFFGLLLINFNVCNAAEEATTAPADEQAATVSDEGDKNVASSEADANSENTYNVNDDFNFNSASFYLTDEQIEDAKNMDKIEDDKTDMDSKIINSSHFSSGTATKTWIPLNKVQK